MVKEEKAITKDALVGMQVINAEGYHIGTVKDVAFTVGKMGISLNVQSKDGETTNVNWESIQAVGDFIILQPKSQTQAQAQATTQATGATTSQTTQAQRLCPTCGGQLTYIPQYQRYYSNKCQKYA